VHANGGNSLRLWLHTAGTKTPQFSPIASPDGLVTGPGENTISDLKKILDLAYQNEIGMMLCLWSFDMMRTSNGSAYTGRARLMLNDTSATMKYINNALIPMVEALKEHPAILSWEVFNEPEGMSVEFGWPTITSADIPMANIQRFINLVAGAIHRTDPKAKVTNGSWSFKATTDIPTLAKENPREILESLSDEQKEKIEDVVKAKYGVNLSAEKILEEFSSNANNFNYYRDDRLIAAGGDPYGYLDFYTVHWYSTIDGTIKLSPFHYPYSFWNLDKPMVMAEFFMVDAFAIPYTELYQNLYDNGYAGAMSWSWNGDNPNSSSNTRTIAAMLDLWQQHHEDIVLNPKTGTIYIFKISPAAIEKGDSALITWELEDGTTATINGGNIANSGSLYVNPSISTYYELKTYGDNPSTSSIRLEVHPAGRIFSFAALPNQVEAGARSLLKWNVAKGGAVVTLNEVLVGDKDSMEVFPTQTTSYKLKTVGDVTDSSTITITVLPSLQVNRTLNKPVWSSSNEDNPLTNNPAYAVDGDLSTLWSSDYADAQWFKIDLVDTFAINKIIIKWGSFYAQTFRVGASRDDKAYQLLLTDLNANGGNDTLNNLSVTSRYIKIMLDKRATSYGFSIKEIESYGLRVTTGIDNSTDVTQQIFSLSQNYPNPFNPTTKIKYSIPVGANCNSPLRLKVYDVLGNEVATLVNEEKPAGEYEVEFNGSALSSGVYFYQLTSGEFISTKKFILVK